MVASTIKEKSAYEQSSNEEGNKQNRDYGNTIVSVEQTDLYKKHSIQRKYLQSTDEQQANIQTKVLSSEENLAVEAAIAIVINGIHYAVLMASPSELEYLAVGFLFSEGLIEHSHELLDWEVTHLSTEADVQYYTNSNDEGGAGKVDSLLKQLSDYKIFIVELTLNQRGHQRIQAQRRQLTGRTGCGMCGITGLTQAVPDLSAFKKSITPKPTLEYLLDLRHQIEVAQETHQLTGAVHAAGTSINNQLYLFEDVGRHNAMDKLIGWQLRHNMELDCILMTSRMSIELVQKSIRCRLPWLIGMSAPTSTAVQVAQHYGLGLAGFLRDNRVTYYSY